MHDAPPVPRAWSVASLEARQPVCGLPARRVVLVADLGGQRGHAQFSDVAQDFEAVPGGDVVAVGVAAVVQVSASSQPVVTRETAVETRSHSGGP